MEFVKLSERSSDIAVLEKINEEAFPEHERNLLSDLIKTGASVYGIYEYDEAIGFFVVREFKEILYIAYLAVRSDSRGRGIGKAAITELINTYYDKQVIIEYEAPMSIKANSAECLRRRNFYRRCGIRQTGWFTFYDETEYEIGCAGAPFDIDMFDEFIDYLSTLFSDHIPHPYRKD